MRNVIFLLSRLMSFDSQVECYGDMMAHYKMTMHGSPKSLAYPNLNLFIFFPPIVLFVSPFLMSIHTDFLFVDFFKRISLSFRTISTLSIDRAEYFYRYVYVPIAYRIGFAFVFNNMLAFTLLYAIRYQQHTDVLKSMTFSIMTRFSTNIQQKIKKKIVDFFMNKINGSLWHFLAL